MEDNQSVSKVGATTAHSSMCVYGVSVASNNGSSQNCMDLEEGMAIDMGGSATGMAKASYVAALSRSSCVNPRNLMVLGDEVEIALQTGDVVADHNPINVEDNVEDPMKNDMQGNASSQNWSSSMETRARKLHPLYMKKPILPKTPDKATLSDWIPMMTQNVDAMASNLVNQGCQLRTQRKPLVRRDASLELRMHLKCFIKDNVKSLLALLETRISGNKADSVDFISLEIEVITTQFIHYHIFSSCISMPVFVTIVYESPNIFYQNFPWKKLEAINPGENAPWILKGDFNSLLDEDERIGGVRGQYRVSRSFHDFNFRTGLIDGGFQGPNLLGLMVISNNV
ncbi:hypothetical protein V6N11_028939 [Hibiscus sabdariffa]|uniref:Uncharacterized protein n=1 Tax=Hibiscus sabdariffa TaxID=183260 RepID=A0ABR2N7W5_9ROSI